MLRYFSIAGIVLIPLMLAAGWMAKFARWSHGSPLADLSERLGAMLERLRARRRGKALAMTEVETAPFDQAEFDEAAYDEGAFDDADEGAHREAAFVDAPPVSPAPSRRRASPDWRTHAVTDPAHDLKKSLTELMRDLRRAAEPEEPAGYAQQPYERAGERVLSPSLQPAE